eukprot:scaffold76761_cov69-Phaeocystis_antarctica.AAC.3
MRACRRTASRHCSAATHARIASLKAAVRGATCCAASRARVERASCQRSEAACAVTAAPPARALGGSAAASISE